MKLAAASALLAATAAVAAPLEARAAVTDADILQYALTLEHLENVFYKGALAKFSEADFVKAGYTKEYYNNLKYIAYDEEQHVKLLTGALAKAGAKPVAVCEYKFPYTDPKSFVTLSSVLEGVGTSAYLGGAGLIQSKDYLTVAGSILVTEALHTSLQRYSLKQVAAANPYGTPLGLNEVYTLAAAFIVKCPSTNVALPVKAFPALTLTSAAATQVGCGATLTTKAQLQQGYYLTFVSGLSVTSVKASVSGGTIKADIPATASGQTYVVVTKTAVTKLTDADVVAGPAIIEVSPPPPTLDGTL